MNGFVLAEYAAWALSAVLIAWMLIDLIKTNRAYSEDFLLSAREGELEAAEHEQEIKAGQHHV